MSNQIQTQANIKETEENRGGCSVQMGQEVKKRAASLAVAKIEVLEREAAID